MPTLKTPEATSSSSGSTANANSPSRKAGEQPRHRLQSVMATPLLLICHLCIALGILSLLGLWTPLGAGPMGWFLVQPDEALGLIFVGFALRISRLEALRRVRWVMVRTSKVCLVVIGLTGVLGLQVLPGPNAGQLGKGANLAASLCFLFIGLELLARQRHTILNVQVTVRMLTYSVLAACWISQLLAWMHLSAVPRALAIHPVLFVLLTGLCVGMYLQSKRPAVLRVLYQAGPEAEAARALFPLTFLIPILLAILRQHAEAAGWIQPDLGLSVHVLLSAGSMAVMVVWYAHRIESAQRLRESEGGGVETMETQYHELFFVLQDPVWIFNFQGQTTFRNAAARRFLPPGGGLVGRQDGPGSSLGANQERMVLSAALLDSQMAKIEVWERSTSTPKVLPVLFLRALRAPDGTPRSIILVGGGCRETGLDNLWRAVDHAPAKAAVQVTGNTN